MSKEGLNSKLLRFSSSFAPDFETSPYLSESERQLHFAMRSNGYFLQPNGQWGIEGATDRIFKDEFTGTNVSFFGPNGSSIYFGFGSSVGEKNLIPALGQKSTTELLKKIREVDEDKAARISYLLGGLVRFMTRNSSTKEAGWKEAVESVNFASRKILLGEEKSYEAIAAAVSVYIISGGSLEEDNKFNGSIYHMSEAIREDPVVPLETVDLGLSQVARLHSYLNRFTNVGEQDLLSVSPQLGYFADFPTVGAEFHIPFYEARRYPELWQRLAILNMSQYQEGSYVQFSRIDRDIVEIRMNPSFYPITISDWLHMRKILPEMNESYFTLTINRKNTNWDFSWLKKEDVKIINQLRALGLISYAGVFENIPRTEKSEEVAFGTVYLGQTVRIEDGEYKFTGAFGNGNGSNGQIGIYAGFGDTLPLLSYFLSMSLFNPDILRPIDYQLGRVTTLEDAFYKLSSYNRRYVFREIQEQIERDTRFNKIFEAGEKIKKYLDPENLV